MQIDRTDVTKLEPGHVLACLNYYVVTAVEPNVVGVKDGNGNQLTIEKRIVGHECWSADTFTSTDATSKTEVAKRILAAGDKVFTVVFIKKDGTLRTMRGHLQSAHEDHTLFGMVKVCDLDLVMAGTNPGAAGRLVTFDNVVSLTIDNVHYTVKSNAKRARDAA